jgi:pectin methylesterase-like acyl-CoA thioesterase
MFSARVAATYIAATFGLAGVAQAASFYVSPQGSDANRGTSINAPLRTIQQAVNAARPGDTILVRGGTYRETISTPRSGTSRAPITIQNYGNEGSSTMAV